MPRGGAGLTLARVANDAMAELCVKYPDRFAGFVAALSLTDVMGSVEEAKRAINDLGAAGVQIFIAACRPAARRAGLRAALRRHGAARPADLAASRPAPPPCRIIRPSRNPASRCGGASVGPTTPRSPWCGWCSAACSTAIPNLKIITHHLGGMIPFYDGRVGPGLDVLGARTSDEDYSKILPSLKRPHLDYMHDFYADTAMFGGGVHALRCGFEFFGADKVVFATDTPLGPIKPAIEALNALDISAADRRKIFSGNAEGLLRKLN